MQKFSYFLGFLLIGAVGAPLIGNLYEAEANYTLLPCSLGWVRIHRLATT